MVQKAIYLVRAVNGLYKFGVSFTPFNRFRGLYNSSPIELYLLYVSWPDNADQIELDVFSRFTAKRHHGEWFEFDSRDVAWIIRTYPGEVIRWSKAKFDDAAESAIAFAKQVGTAAIVYQTPGREAFWSAVMPPNNSVPVATVTRKGEIYPSSQPKERACRAHQTKLFPGNFA